MIVILIKAWLAIINCEKRALIWQFARLVEAVYLYVVFTRNQITHFTAIYVTRAVTVSPCAFSMMCKSRASAATKARQKCIRGARSISEQGLKPV